MYLKKLEISGFKSFANKTALDFLVSDNGQRCITAIVGPNGSGKSNIADALRWVMGEQSMKNLRGKKSEDIIFAGSGKKARLGSAHVTLYLDNNDKKLPLDFEEVSIARKIFRSGESEYLINGSKTRLQDIVDILAKAGVGKESYAIINQGMADAALNATPMDRRLIIEDAAGVKQYQIKKERSLRKLESTRQNLERSRELAEEIKPHLRLLKRQAEKASQSETVAKELAEKQSRLFSWLWHNFQKEKNELSEIKDEAGRIMMNVQRDADKLADELQAESKEKKDQKHETEWENKAREVRIALNQLEKDLVITEGRIEIEKEKIKNSEIMEEINAKIPESVSVDLNYVKAGLESIRREQEKLIERIGKAEKLEDLQDIKEFARVIQQKLYDLKADIENGKTRNNTNEEIETRNNTNEKQSDAEKKQDNKENNSSVLIGLQEKILKIREEIKNYENKLREIDLEIQKEIAIDRERRYKFFEIEKRIRVKQDELNKLKDKFNEAKISLARVETREEDLRNQVKMELKKEAENLQIFEGEIDRAGLESEIGKLKVKMEQIGGIDPMVVDEYNETNTRYEFLTRESDDLERATLSLKEVIKEMEQKIEKEFTATFLEINKEFSKYFRIIFGGGSARLEKLKVKSAGWRKKTKLNNADDAEEAVDDVNLNNGESASAEDTADEVGIDIFACPPGKRISNLSMLSGGERSLTSLALLFAIISHNPPPFAVLDEMEAALDEANSKRFGRIIQELSNNTQFVIITHNRETMRQASLLYGVTMGEDGISKLLSVKLDQVGVGGKISVKN